MATAGDVNFSGRIGEGEAQVLQERVSPLLQFQAQQQQRAAQNELAGRRLQYQDQQRRNAEVNKYINDNIGKPTGWFQLENSVKELNDVRSTMENASFENPQLDPRALGVMYGQDRNRVKERVGKRLEIQKEIEQIRTGMNSPNSMLDNNWVTTQANKVYDTDVDQIDRGSIVGLQNHPRAFDAEKGIVRSVKDIANQHQTTGTSGPQDIGFGIQIDGYTKKVRFKTDKNGRIADDTVDFVLDSNPGISQRLRWDYARQMAGIRDDTFSSPEDMKKIQENFQRVQFSDDPEVVNYVRGKVRQGLDQLQKYEYIDRVKFQNKPKAGAGDITEEDVTNRMKKIMAIKKAINSGAPEHSGNANNYIAELIGQAKHQGMPVTDIKLIPDQYDKKRKLIEKGKVVITMKSGVEGGEVLPHTVEIPVSDPQFEEKFNNLWNSTHSTTGEKEITGDKLRGESPYLDEDDNDSEFLDD